MGELACSTGVMCDDVEYIVWQWHATVARVQRFLWPFALARAHVLLKILNGPYLMMLKSVMKNGRLTAPLGPRPLYHRGAIVASQGRGAIELGNGIKDQANKLQGAIARRHRAWHRAFAIEPSRPGLSFNQCPHCQWVGTSQVTLRSDVQVHCEFDGIPKREGV